MGTMGKKIIEIDSIKLVNDLNRLFADEWLAYYQYWVGAKIVRGPMRTAVVTELDEHAADELRHAQMLSVRIIQLGGKPILNPNEWSKLANCKYLEPSDPHVKEILKQNIKGEQCAIEGYNKLIKEIMGKDVATYDMLSQILEDEIEHEDDLEAILEDINLIK